MMKYDIKVTNEEVDKEYVFYIAREIADAGDLMYFVNIFEILFNLTIREDCGIHTNVYTTHSYLDMNNDQIRRDTDSNKLVEWYVELIRQTNNANELVIKFSIFTEGEETEDFCQRDYFTLDHWYMTLTNSNH